MAITAGDNLNSVPAPKKATLSANYIDFTSSSTAGWFLETELSQDFYLKLERKSL